MEHLTKGHFMSDDSQAKNKHQKHPKVHFERYLLNTAEPADNSARDIPPRLDSFESLELNTRLISRRIKEIAQRIRNNL